VHHRQWFVASWGGSGSSALVNLLRHQQPGSRIWHVHPRQLPPPGSWPAFDQQTEDFREYSPARSNRNASCSPHVVFVHRDPTEALASVVLRYTLGRACANLLRNKERCRALAERYQPGTRHLHVKSDADRRGAEALLRDVASGALGDVFGYKEVWATFRQAVEATDRVFPLTLLAYSAMLNHSDALTCALRALCLPPKPELALDLQPHARNLRLYNRSLQPGSTPCNHVHDRRRLCQLAPRRMAG